MDAPTCRPLTIHCHAPLEAIMAMDSLAGYKSLDFKQSDISFPFRFHDPPKNLHARRKSPSSIKSDVLDSPRIRWTVSEVSSLLSQI